LVRTTKNEIWRAIFKDKIDVLTDEQNRDWVNKKDFDYLYLEYRSLLISTGVLLLCIFVLALMYMFSGVK